MGVPNVLDKERCWFRISETVEKSKFMTKKQLADVFIKILGLYFCVDGVIRVIAGMISLLATLTTRFSTGSIYVWATPFTGMVLVVIGFLFIVLSRAIADFLFRDE